MNLSVVNISDNSAANAIEVNEVLFGHEEFNEALAHQVINAALSAARQGTKAQKGRHQISGGGRKPWKQKGTGRARHGSIRSPLWRGGAKTFAASGTRDFSQKVNKKMYKGAMRHMLSALVRQSALTVVEEFSLEAPKTKLLLTKLQPLDLKNVLIVTPYVDENLYLASRNVPSVRVIAAESLGPLDLVSFEHVILTVGAIKKLEEVLA